MNTHQIEALAARLISQTGQTEPPIKLDPILDAIGAIVLKDDAMPVPRGEGRRLDGFCIRGRHRHYILVNRAVTSKTRLRFTVAHEIKHCFDDADCSLFSQTPHLENLPEREANYFAAALLMPETMLRAAVTHGMTVSHLATCFAVSPQAMERRLRDLDL